MSCRSSYLNVSSYVNREDRQSINRITVRIRETVCQMFASLGSS